MRRKDTTHTKGVGTDFHRQPSLIHSQPMTLNSENGILRTLCRVDAEPHSAA